MSFETAFADLLQREGGFVNDPDDHGGPTNHGVTQGTLSDYLGKQATEEEVKSLDLETVKKIYKKNYWDRLNLNLIQEPLASFLLDQAVNRGPQRVAQQLQSIVGVRPDGIIGPFTLSAISERDPKKLMLDMIKRAQISYVDLVYSNPQQLKFLKGWIARTQEFLKL